jgi:hypothetical protein
MAATVIRRVGPLSVGKMLASIYAAIGLIVGCIFALLALVKVGIGPQISGPTGNPVFGALFGVGAVIILPILYAIFAFIGGLIGGAVYNIAAGFAGGIELELVTTGA